MRREGKVKGPGGGGGEETLEFHFDTLNSTEFQVKVQIVPNQFPNGSLPVFSMFFFVNFFPLATLGIKASGFVNQQH